MYVGPNFAISVPVHATLTNGVRASAGTAHHSDVIMGVMVSQITSLTTVYSTVYSGADQSKYQRSVSLVFVRGIHRVPVNSPHKWPVTRKMFPFDDVIVDNGEIKRVSFNCSLTINNFEYVSVMARYFSKWPTRSHEICYRAYHTTKYLYTGS